MMSQSAAAAALSTGKSITATMADLKHEGRTAFIPFLVAGDPSLSTTVEAVRVLDAAGSSVIELGVPYSDPLADGPVIQSAATRALERGCTLKAVLRAVESLVSGGSFAEESASSPDSFVPAGPPVRAPILLFLYYNQLCAQGVEATVKAIAAAGARGLLVPDIPLEETVDVRAACAARGIDLVLLTTPTTPPERARRIAEATAGFLYLVSVTGVTGTQAKVSSRVPELLRELKRATDKPVAVGFGVSRPEHCREIAAAGAEGVICGSALVRALGGEGRVARTPEEARRGVEDMARLARELIAAL